MGLPNWLTILRILLIPVFVTLLVYRRAGLALLVFCLASLTDMLDGYIARSQGRQTRLGAFLDPMADKLLLTSGFVTLTWLKVIPFWITAVVVSRDVVLSIGVLVIHVAGGTVHPAPTWIGKMSTVLPDGHRASRPWPRSTSSSCPAFVTTLLAWVTAAFTITSGLQYIIRGPQAARHAHLRERARLTWPGGRTRRQRAWWWPR